MKTNTFKTLQSEQEMAVVQTQTQVITETQTELEEPKKGKFLWWELETEIRWARAIPLVLINAIALYAVLAHDYFNKPWLTLYVLFGAYIAGFGITAGIHRYWTHRSYKAKLPLRIILILCFSSAGQVPILQWVKDHTVHHKASDTPADPHNARRGIFFSHIGWLMMKKRPEVIQKGKTLDFSYLYEDPLVKFHDRHFIWFKLVTCYLIPTVIPVYLMGETWTVGILAAVVRQMYALHISASINSIAHIFGTKPYDTRILPGQNKLLSMFALGEAFHNYHHIFPYDYRTHEKADFCVTSTLLDFFGWLGWAYDFRYPSPKSIKAVAKKYGDGTFINWGEYSPEEHEVTKEEECEKLL